MKIAILTLDIFSGGGVPAMVRFGYDILSPAHSCHLVSLSTTRHDPYNICLLSPKTWFKGLQFHKALWEGKEVLQIGAFLAEFEFQRYMPRRQLTEYLNQFDVVVIFAGGPSIAYAAKNISKPVLLQFATLVREERKQIILNSSLLNKLRIKLNTFISNRIETKALKIADITFVINYWLDTYLKTLIDPNKVSMAPPGVDTDFFQPCDYRDKHDEQGRKYLLSVGRFNDRRKNIPLLFRAYAHLRAINPATPRLILAGRFGPYADDWALADNLGIREHIELRKNISEAELVDLLARAAIFICSSEEEGLGIAMMEALACGTPVITTRCGGPDTFMVDGKNGYFVDKYKAEEMATKINELLLDDALLKQMGLFAREDIVERFSREVTGRKLLAAIDSLALSKR